MTDHDLATLLREHVQDVEPPFLMSASTAIVVGRRTLVRRRARRGFAGVLVAAAAVVAVAVLPWGGSDEPDRTATTPAATATPRPYDAQKMPALLEQHVRAALGDGIDGLGPATFAAFDVQDKILPARSYDQAMGMSLGFGDNGRRMVEVTLQNAHTRSEADVHQICAAALRSHVDLSCTTATSPTGVEVAITVEAVRPMNDGTADWEVLKPAQLQSGVAGDSSPDGQGPIDRSQIRFVRTVESVRNTTFLTSAAETVRAPDRATAEKLWRVPVAALQKVVTDPELVIPDPRG